MSADFLFEYAYWFRDNPLDWAAGTRAIGIMSDEDLKEWADDYYDGAEEYCDDNGDLTPIGRLDLERALKDTQEEMKAILEGHGEQTAIIHVGPYKVAFAGGMSWGDDPSEDFTIFNRYTNVASITQAIGLYPQTSVWAVNERILDAVIEGR